MRKVKPHRFGQACAIKLCKCILGFGKLARSQCGRLNVRFMSGLTLNPGTGIRERVETLSDYGSASEFLAEADTPAIAFLVNIDAGR